MYTSLTLFQLAKTSKKFEIYIVTIKSNEIRKNMVNWICPSVCLSCNRALHMYLHTRRKTQQLKYRFLDHSFSSVIFRFFLSETTGCFRSHFWNYNKNPLQNSTTIERQMCIHYCHQNIETTVVSLINNTFWGIYFSRQ